MALRNVVEEGDPILRKKCRPVDEVNDRVRMILDDMVETMQASDGVGIAAPQVGILRRMFVAQDQDGTVYYMINPEITDRKGTQTGDEGCLSVPGLIGTVERPAYLRIMANDYDGTRREVIAKEFLAVVMSHEYDHLDGILYTDKAKNIRIPEEPDEETEE